jgi:hypothetical protein
VKINDEIHQLMSSDQCFGIETDQTLVLLLVVQDGALTCMTGAQFAIE